MKNKRGRKKKRSYHSTNRGLKRSITHRDAPTDNRPKLSHGGPDWRTIRLRQLIGDGSKLPVNRLSLRREATRQAIAKGTPYVLLDEIDALWPDLAAQFERAMLDGDADWFKRQAHAIEHGDERTGQEKDRGRFEAEVMRLLTVECVPERKILAGDTCFVQRKNAQPLTEKEKHEIHELERTYRHAVIEDMIGKRYRRADDGGYVAVGEGLILEWTVGEHRFSCRFKNRRCARDAVRDIAKRINQKHRFL